MTTSLAPDYSVDDVAHALGMSTRWVRRQIAEGAEHQRYGHKIRFTSAQVDALRAKFTRNDLPAGSGITTRRGRRAS